MVEVGRNPPAIVLYLNGISREYGDIDYATVTCQRLVDRVVYHLIYQVMKAFEADITDVHGRPLPHSLKSFENLNAVGRVILAVFLCCRLSDWIGFFHLILDQFTHYCCFFLPPRNSM